MSHKFGNAVHLFSFNSRESLIYFFSFFLDTVELNRKLFNFDEFVDFLLFLLLLKFSFNLWWPEKIQGVISIPF